MNVKQLIDYLSTLDQSADVVVKVKDNSDWEDKPEFESVQPDVLSIQSAAEVEREGYYTRAYNGQANAPVLVINPSWW